MSVILVVAAHPDDEILGAGATVARRIAEGNEAYALILGEGQTSRWGKRENAGKDVVLALHKDSMEAAKVIGFTDVYLESLPDNRFDRLDLLDVVKLVEKYVGKEKPDIIYTHHQKDLNVDHRITFEAVLTATRPMEDCPVREIFAFETVSSTEWNFGNRERAFYPNVFVDVSGFFEIKCEAMRKYKSELCQFPHPRSIEMLEITAKRWGAIVGQQYVEAFELIRRIDPICESYKRQSIAGMGKIVT